MRAIDVNTLYRCSVAIVHDTTVLHENKPCFQIPIISYIISVLSPFCAIHRLLPTLLIIICIFHLVKQDCNIDLLTDKSSGRLALQSET